MPLSKRDGSKNGRCICQVKRMAEQSLVVSAYEAGKHNLSHYLALGHGLVPNLGAQHLDDAQWHSFPLHLRHGTQVGWVKVYRYKCKPISVMYHLTITTDICFLLNTQISLYYRNKTTLGQHWLPCPVVRGNMAPLPSLPTSSTSGTSRSNDLDLVLHPPSRVGEGEHILLY